MNQSINQSRKGETEKEGKKGERERRNKGRKKVMNERMQRGRDGIGGRVGAE